MSANSISTSAIPRSFSGATELAAVKDRVAPAEWQARVDLAALYRLVAYHRWTDTIYTHISLRVPDEETFLINPFGYLFEEVTASCLVKVDVLGRIVDDPVGLGINKAGFVIHGAIHAARENVHCVVHTHTAAGAGVSAQRDGLLPISQHAAVFIGRVAYHDFEGIAIYEDEQARLVADLGDRSVMILRNHGLLAAGRSAGEAFYLISSLERACQIQVAALAAGAANVRHITPESIAASQAVVDSVEGDFSRDWSAMLRLVERIAPGYKS